MDRFSLRNYSRRNFTQGTWFFHASYAKVSVSKKLNVDGLILWKNYVSAFIWDVLYKFENHFQFNQNNFRNMSKYLISSKMRNNGRIYLLWKSRIWQNCCRRICYIPRKLSDCREHRPKMTSWLPSSKKLLVSGVDYDHIKRELLFDNQQEWQVDKVCYRSGFNGMFCEIIPTISNLATKMRSFEWE